ncbi:putative zinc ribbon protein [Enterobacter hormaechei]
MIPEAWYCVWCGRNYVREKYYAVCNTGIYSIEETTWRENFSCSIDDTPPYPPEDRHSSPLTAGGGRR